MIILGINDATHDHSMSLLVWQKIYSIELERLSRMKHWIFRSADQTTFINSYFTWKGAVDRQLTDEIDFRSFWVKLMLKYLLRCSGISIKDIDLIVSSSWWRYGKIFWDRSFLKLPSHHLWHASSSYFLSGFKNSALLVIDGAWYDEEWNIELQSMYTGDNTDIRVLKKTFATKNGTIGIGIAYERISKFFWLTEGKFMGLSSYGKTYGKHWFFSHHKGEVRLKSKYTGLFSDERLFLDYFWITDSVRSHNYFDESVLNLAHSFQREVEDAIVYLAKYLRNVSGSDNLCYAGWVWLNCLSNTRIHAESGFKNIFIQPAASDSGISLGCVMYGYYAYQDKLSLFDVSDYWMGMVYDKTAIRKAIAHYEAHLCVQDAVWPDNKAALVSELLKNGKIVGIFCAGSEFWPRALGNRSIFANPKIPGIRDRLNKLKNRELWRPFGVMFLEEDADEYLEIWIKSENMLFIDFFKKKYSMEYKEISHFDWSIRTQTISTHRVFQHELLQKTKEYNLWCIINTSLNDRFEPIIERPEEALEFLLSSDLDYLLIEDYLVQKKSDMDYPRKNIYGNLKETLESVKSTLREKAPHVCTDVYVSYSIETMVLHFFIWKDWKVTEYDSDDAYIINLLWSKYLIDVMNSIRKEVLGCYKWL